MPQNPHFTLAMLMLGVTIIGANSLLLSPILTDVATGLDASVRSVSLAIAAFGGATALSALLFGGLIDRHGPRRVLSVGAAVMVVGITASGLATHWLILAGAQALAGMASGVMLPAIYMAAAQAGPPERSAQRLGRVLTGWSLAMLAAVPLAAWIAALAGWRYCYALLAALTLATLIGMLRLQVPAQARPAPGAGTRLKALRQPEVASLLAVQFCFMGAFYGSYSFIGDHIRTTLDVSAATAGQIVLAYGAGFGLASLADGVLDRIGARRGLPIAMALTVGVHVALAPATAAITTAILAGGIWGLTNHYAINLIVLRLTEVGGARRGSVLALNSAVTYLGALVGPLAAGALYTGAGFWAVTLFGTGLLATGTVIAATLALRARTHAAVAP